MSTPSREDLLEAFAATRRTTRETPLLESPALAEAVGASRVFVKAESLQIAGSFKIRGATWRLARLDVAARDRGVVAYSSGNFAQGLAAAGRRAGVAVTIVMPVDAPPDKREATRRLGARVVVSEHGDRPREEAASERARELAEAEGLSLLHPFDDPVIVAGQAGAGLEAIEQLEGRGEEVDTVLCPVGGGGLIGGVSLAFHHHAPVTRTFAVEPAGYDAMGESLRRGAITRVASGRPTICDALQATSPGAAPFAAARQAEVSGVAIEDAKVRAAMRFAVERLKLILEPSGAIAVAAALSGKVDLRERRVLVYATGGNVSSSQLARILES